VLLGQAVAPAILTSSMNMKYTSVLAANLPPELESIADEKLKESLVDSKVLLSQSAMAALSETIGNSGPDGPVILERTIDAIRLAMEAGLKVIFTIGAIAMILTFLTICLLPSLSIDTPPMEDGP
jgi:hypothetical protein